MKCRETSFIAALAAVSLVAFAGCVQNKDSDGDGNKEVVISSECSWYGGVECEAACETTDFEFYCEGGCTGDIDLPTCEANCDAECHAECDVDPGSFSCEGYCGGECGADCSGDCEASDDQASCEGECQAYCEGECSASCEGTPTEVDCDAGCSASCEGGCTGGNIDFGCYLDCEIESPIECTGGCDSEGMLECEGEFISSDDLQTAIDWVEANMTAEVTYEGSADCHGNTCEAEASASIECDAAAPGRADDSGLLAVLSSLL
jgi:hypothetical protein